MMLACREGREVRGRDGWRKYTRCQRWTWGAERCGGGSILMQWRRLVQNIRWANQTIGGIRELKSDKYMSVSQLLGGTCSGCPPKSTPMYLRIRMTTTIATIQRIAQGEVQTV